MAGSNAAPITNTSGALSTVNAGTLAAGSSSSAPISVTTLGNLITLRLTRDNFLLWKTQAVPALASNGLFGYVAGTEEAPPQTLIEGTGDVAVEVANPEFLRWFQKDQLVMIVLLGSMTEDILGQMTQLTTSAQVWTTLHELFASQNRARIMQLRYQLSNLKKKDLTASEYYRKMRGFADAMASIGKPLDDDEVLGYILAGLGPEFEALVASITARNDPISLSSFYAFFLSAELRLEQQASSGNIHPSANVCSKFGHDALHCRNRFNHAFQPEEQRERSGNVANTGPGGSYSVDTDWYVDTGATDHLTSDLDRLSFHEKYGGKDKVHAANGAGPSNEGGSSSK
ncbi:hypothetical protein VPH35_138255 [Triticum aestivum]